MCKIDEMLIKYNNQNLFLSDNFLLKLMIK